MPSFGDSSRNTGFGAAVVGDPPMNAHYQNLHRTDGLPHNFALHPMGTVAVHGVRRPPCLLRMPTAECGVKRADHSGEAVAEIDGCRFEVPQPRAC